MMCNGSLFIVMACKRRGGTKRQRKTQKGGRNPFSKRQRKTQKGGRNPFYVDFKKGINVTKEMIKSLKKPVNVSKAKATVAGYKHQYQQYKNTGGTKSYKSWILDKGYGVKDGASNCCIMEGLPGGVLVPLFPSKIALCSHVPTYFRQLFPFYQIRLPATPPLNFLPMVTDST